LIHIVCMNCSFGLRVSPGQDGERDGIIGPHDEWFPDRYPCCRCGGLMTIAAAVDKDTFPQLELVDVSPPEALAALHGLGLPHERECSPTAVQKVMTGAHVKRVTIRNSHRSILEYIELENGTRLYLAASAFGATVYRISPRGSYVEEVLRDG